MEKVLKWDKNSNSKESDIIHVEFDARCSKDVVFRETMVFSVPENKDVDTNQVISKVKTAFLDKYKREEEFKSKYAKHVDPGMQLELTVISWIRQPSSPE